jgi:hypothetical protein
MASGIEVDDMAAGERLQEEGEIQRLRKLTDREVGGGDSRRVPRGCGDSGRTSQVRSAAADPPCLAGVNLGIPAQVCG